MTKYDVTARAFDRKTGNIVGKERTERIDTVTNELFKGIKTIVGIKTKYESFWNDLNPNSREVVFVSRVKRIK